MNSKKILEFLKPFVTEDREQRMRIPPHFSNFLKDRMPCDAFIRDCNEKMWHVVVSQRNGYYFFEEGWSKFVQEKNVELGDFLVFEYDGQSIFDVKLFGKTACRKDEYEEEEIKLDEEEEDDDIDKVSKLRRSTKGECSIKGESCSGVKKKNKKSPAVLEDKAIFDLKTVDRPKNPYFIAKLNSKRMSDLLIPSNVIQYFNLKLPKQIEVSDEHGRTWNSVVTNWHDGRMSLTKGWSTFWRVNGIKPNDRCLCEFVPGKGKDKVRLQIRIIRATSIM